MSDILIGILSVIAFFVLGIPITYVLFAVAMKYASWLDSKLRLFDKE